MGTVGKGNSRTRPAELGYTPPVQNFVNLEALCGVMEKAYQAGAGDRLSTPLEAFGPRPTGGSWTAHHRDHPGGRRRAPVHLGVDRSGEPFPFLVPDRRLRVRPYVLR